MKIVNCTPHAINFVNDTGEVIRTIEPSGILPRVSSSIEVVGEIDGIPDESTSYGDVVDLPEKQDGVILVVSAMVASRLPDRDDLRIPGRQVRNDRGQIIGCKSLSNPNKGFAEAEAKIQAWDTPSLSGISTMDPEMLGWYAAGISDAKKMFLGI